MHEYITIQTKLLAAVFFAFCGTYFSSSAIATQEASAAAESGAVMIMQVGPERAVKTLAQASRLALDGTTIEVDAGDYHGDISIWTQKQITVRAVGGRVRLIAKGAAAEGKAIWVVRTGQMAVEGFEFTGTQVSGRNGAGIRLESGKLMVRNCRFINNENGIMTSNNPEIELDIVDSEFAHNGYGDGQSHNLYAGAIARLSVTGSYFHHALVGHLLKSRAAVNDIRYNRLADGPGGRASYELEIANGGVAYIVGNIIEQSEKTENPYIISYATEGYRWKENSLHLVHNTLVDKKASGGVLLRVRPGNAKIYAVNNLLIGPGKLDMANNGYYANNVNADNRVFDSAKPDEYRPRSGAQLTGSLDHIHGNSNTPPLQLQFEYRDPVGTEPLNERPRFAGALQPRRESSQRRATPRP
jgi:hypothetical protein